MPSAEQRLVRVSVTGLDRLRSDPYEFYAARILRLSELEALDAEHDAKWRGNAAHKVLEVWHREGRPMAEIARLIRAAVSEAPSGSRRGPTPVSQSSAYVRPANA